MSTPMLAIRGLGKRYGKKIALEDLTLTLERGDVYGLIGPNGAGKTTTFKIVATIMRQSEGTVELDGIPLGDKKRLNEVRRKIGYMPDSFGVYEDMTVEEYLTFFAAAYDIENPKRQQLVGDVLALVDLDVKKDALIDALSRGMQQRLGLARTLIHDPDLLILDEPASGLDPRARVEIRSLLMELQRMGKTILISSHILADIGEICNRIGIIEQGKLKLEGTIADILDRVNPSPIVKIRVRDRHDEALALLQQQDFIEKAYAEQVAIVVELPTGSEETWRLAKLLIDNDFQLDQLQPEAKSLEHAFLELTEGKVS